MTNAGIVRRFLTESYENKNYTAVMACLAEDYIDHSPAGARGSAQAVDILSWLRRSFPG
ncbi:MAG: nuclear transport factor 2 family protein [Eubacteriales bacterium]|nr:nuclear transport factor 2 family protein [Eubacteriales bacterium]